MEEDRAGGLPFVCTCCPQALGEGHLCSPLPAFHDHLSLTLKTQSILGGSPGTEPQEVQEGSRCQVLERSPPGTSVGLDYQHLKALVSQGDSHSLAEWPPTSFTSQIPEGRTPGEGTLRGPAAVCDSDFPFPKDPEASAQQAEAAG